MRLISLIIFSLFLYSLQAQTQEDRHRASIAIQTTFNQLGGTAEIFYKANSSVWTTFSYYQNSRELGFGTDTTSGNFFTPPLEKEYYENIQQSITIRAGVRFYQASRKKQWSFWYSPVIGYTNLSEPTEEYREAYLREDLHYLSAIFGGYRAKRTLQLGGEVGTRWLFWRKPQTNTGLYIEGSGLMLGQRSLLNERTNREFASLEL